jgi:hypothetical protein
MGQSRKKGQKEGSSVIVPGQRDNRTSSTSCHGIGRDETLTYCHGTGQDGILTVCPRRGTEGKKEKKIKILGKIILFYNF